MARPVVDSVSVVPSVVRPGETSRITVVAHDPDAAPITLELRVLDSSGNVGVPTIAVLNVSDNLFYECVERDGTRAVVVPVDGQPGVFDVTVVA